MARGWAGAEQEGVELSPESHECNLPREVEAYSAVKKVADEKPAAALCGTLDSCASRRSSEAPSRGEAQSSGPRSPGDRCRGSALPSSTDSSLTGFRRLRARSTSIGPWQAVVQSITIRVRWFTTAYFHHPEEFLPGSSPVGPGQAH